MIIKKSQKRQIKVRQVKIYRSTFQLTGLFLTFVLFSTISHAQSELNWYLKIAAENNGGFWLCTEKEIKNPYFCNNMLDCGGVIEIVLKNNKYE